MKKFFIVVLLFALHSRLFAQQFSQYNTGTLYDSFENPSQKAFIPDSSRKIAFNFLIPNLNGDITFSGNAQAMLKKRLFLNYYDAAGLIIGKNNFNYAKVDVNIYFLMLKLYNNLEGNEEIGLSGQTRFEGRGVTSDESAQLLADNSKFTNSSYSDIFAYRYHYQAYHQLSLTFRKDIDKQFSIGVKAGLLLGIVSNEVDVLHSVLNISRTDDQAFLSLLGNYRGSFEPGQVYTAHDFIPSFKNPGASVSIGTTYTSDDHIKVQLNLKDLGFIHWNSQSFYGEFNNTGVLNGLSLPTFPDTLIKTTSSLVQARNINRSYTTLTNGRVEISGSKSYWLDSWGIKYTPTAILSKELLYTGFTGALVNHFQYQNYTGTVTASYDDMKYANIGLQFMVKNPNSEFFIGCDRILQTAQFLSAVSGSSQTSANNAYTGENFYIGFSVKIGPVIEHNNNSHLIPMGDHRSFFKRLWQRITGYTD